MGPWRRRRRVFDALDHGAIIPGLVQQCALRNRRSLRLAILVATDLWSRAHKNTNFDFALIRLIGSPASFVGLLRNRRSWPEICW